MKKSINIIVVILTLFMINACTKYKLTKEDKKWQPYKEGDVLIFKSSKNEVDSIFISKIETSINGDDPLTPKSFNQSLFIDADVSLKKPRIQNKKPYYRESIGTLSMYAEKSGSYITFSLNKKNDTLDYPTLELSIDSLANLFKIRSKLKYKSIEISLGDNNDFSHDLKNYWWSKEFGYVRYEFKNGYYWELKKFLRKGKDILK